MNEGSYRLETDLRANRLRTSARVHRGSTNRRLTVDEKSANLETLLWYERNKRLLHVLFEEDFSYRVVTVAMLYHTTSSTLYNNTTRLYLKFIMKHVQ